MQNVFDYVEGGYSQDAREAASVTRKPGQHSAELTAIGETRFASFSYCRGGRRVDM